MLKFLTFGDSPQGTLSIRICIFFFLGSFYVLNVHFLGYFHYAILVFEWKSMFTYNLNFVELCVLLFVFDKSLVILPICKTIILTHTRFKQSVLAWLSIHKLPSHLIVLYGFQHWSFVFQVFSLILLYILLMADLLK